MSAHTTPRSDERFRRALLAPRSVALLGASGDPASVTSRPLAYLQAAGWPGTVYPINPARGAVRGVPAWPSLRDLPEVPEHVLIMTKSEQVVPAVADCAALGVPVATIVASGFAEAGPDGRALQERLLATIGESGTRVLGPSSLGVVNLHERLLLTANAAFAEPDPPPGDLFVASQSGSIIGALLSRGAEMGFGFAGLVSTGGEADLSLGEICSATLDDPAIGGYAVFLESLSHLDALRTFSVEAATRGRPVVAYMVGRSSVAADLAGTHTGVIADDDTVASAVLADLGIVRVDTFEALLEAQPLARRLLTRPHPFDSQHPAPRIGVVSTTGGGAAMVIDQLAVRGAVVKPPGRRAIERLRTVGIATGPGPLIDLTLAGARYEVMKAALETTLTSGDFDLVVAVAGSSARFQPDLAVRPIVDSAEAGVPVVAFVVPEAPEALRLLRRSGLPAFRTPESCADAVTAALRRRPPRSHAPRSRPAGPVPPNPGAASTEDMSYRILDTLGVPHAPWALIDVAALPAAMPFDGPLVVKARAAGLPHKSDVGGVVLDVRGSENLARAVETIVTNVRRYAPGVDLRHCLIQPMVTGLTEVLVGFRVSPTGIPVVVLSAGGVLADVLDARSVRVAPVDMSTARTMIQEIPMLRRLAARRGTVSGDLDALAESIVAISRAVELDDPPVTELEANPLLVLPEGQGVLAIDSLAVPYYSDPP